jgi:hypothetical protein
MIYIVIEGVIGVGKTALTRMLGEQFSVPTLFEQFEENPFLKRYTLSTNCGRMPAFLGCAAGRLSAFLGCCNSRQYIIKVS